MLRRISFNSKQNNRPSSSSSSSLPPLATSNGTSNYAINSSDTTPTRSSSLPSPTISLTHEYTLAVQTKSYNEIWSKIHIYQDDDQDHQTLIRTSSSSQHLVSQVLQPNRELVDQALLRVKPTSSIKLVSLYFDHSEKTSHLLCILLHQSIDRARSLYFPLHELLDVLPDESLSQLQCDRAYDIFVQFDRVDNPFSHPISDTFEETRLCFSQLKEQVDYRLRKARKQIRPHYKFFRNSALCLGTLVSRPLQVSHSLPSRIGKNQNHHIAQLDAAAKGAYVLNNDLNTIDRLVARLHGVVESDKVLVKIGLLRGRDRFPIQEVVKQLKKSQPNFINQLRDLEEHVCLCFNTVNHARSLLLREIHLQQNM
ncbi:hypothetical protein ACHQM5_015722 [Ranunculus cassubicifolius]